MPLFQLETPPSCKRILRPVEFGVVGVVVLRVHLVLRDTEGVSDFTVSNIWTRLKRLLRKTVSLYNGGDGWSYPYDNDKENLYELSRMA